MGDAPKLYRDADADLAVLEDLCVAVLGYGNQGRSQALNLRDSGVEVIVASLADESAVMAREDGFEPTSLADATARGQVLLFLVPDEQMPQVFENSLRPGLSAGDTLIFASGYAIAFERIAPPAEIDIALVAPRMFGPGVRERYLSGEGFPAFVAVEHDASGGAWARTLAIAKAIGATRGGALELSFQQEATLDLFNEQAFGPAFGMVLTNAVATLVDAGIPAEAALLEILHSGEFAYALERMRREGVIEQMEHHSQTSQYGAMTRAIRFLDLDLRGRMEGVLENIRSGDFAREWAEEQRTGCENLGKLRAAREQHPLRRWDRLTRALFGPKSDA